MRTRLPEAARDRLRSVQQQERDSRLVPAVTGRSVAQTGFLAGHRVVARNYTRRARRPRALAASPVHLSDRYERHSLRWAMARNTGSDGRRAGIVESEIVSSLI